MTLFQSRGGTLIGRQSTPRRTQAPDLGVDLRNSTAFQKRSAGGRRTGRSDADVFQGLVEQLSGAYKPERIAYRRREKDELLSEISAWLRPAYDAAIAERENATSRYRAELDADAIARGMGSSSYVTDMKHRQLLAEANDVGALESDYAAALAKQLSDALETERERAYEADVFNANAENEARQKAYDAALTLFAAYKADRRRGGGRSKVKTTSAANCEAFLSGLSPRERGAIYNGSTSMGAAYRSELIASVGESGFAALKRKYPAGR